MLLVGVVGVGSPFGDDNIAQRVITQLQRESQHKKSADKLVFEYFDRPGIHLLEYMKAFDRVHLIDAIVSDSPVGTIHHFDSFDSFQKHKQILSSHDFDIVQVLKLGQILNLLPKALMIHGIEIDPNHELPVKVGQIDKLCKELLMMIERAI